MLKKIFISRNAVIFSIEHPWNKVIQGCLNEVPGVTNSHALIRVIGLYSQNKSSH